MNFASISIKRPTFIMSIVMVILVVGAVSFMKLGVDRFPNVNFPIVMVMTQYNGAGPNEIETQVTKPMEEQISSVAGLKHLNSINMEGISIVVAEFDLGGDIKDLEQQVRAKAAFAKTMMPDTVNEPMIRRMDPSDSPIVIAMVTADLNPRDLYTLTDQKVKPLIAQVDGVANVDIHGGVKREIQVLLDRKKLEDHQISITAVNGRIAGSSMNIPIGKVTEGDRDLSFRTMGEYRSLDQIRNIPVNFVGSDVPVTVGDLGEVVDGSQDPTGYVFHNNKASVFMMIYRQSGTNTVKVADKAIAEIAKINKDMAKAPGHPKVATIVDLSKMIRMNISDVQTTILEGILLAIIVVYLFLGSARSTFITTVALPNSLMGSFILMGLMGFTINTITLMALSLAVGLLIDDAIVVRENIWRHMEKGMPPREAAIKGTKEVTMAVIATTLTIISVFLPIGFLSGMMGQFFKELGLTIVFAMAISFFDAMTTAPLLSAYLAKKTNGNGRKTGNGRSRSTGWQSFLYVLYFLPKLGVSLTRSFQDNLVAFYEKVIRWSLANRWKVVGFTFALLVAAGFLVRTIKTEFMPPADTGSYIVKIECPPGTSLDATLVKAREVQEVILKRKQNKDISMIIGGMGFGGGGNMGTFFVEMTPSNTRKITVTEMKQKIRDDLAKRKDMIIKVEDMQVMNTGGSAAFNMSIRGDNLELLAATAEKVKKEFAKVPDLVDLDLDFRTGNPELQFRLEPDKIKAMGASTIAVGTELRYLVDGSVAAKFRDVDDEYDIRVFLRKDQRDLQGWLGEVKVPNNNFQQVRLLDVATPVKASGLTKITRKDRVRFINVMGNIGPKGTLGSVQGATEKIMAKMKLPNGVSYQFWGTSEYFVEMLHNIMIAMAMSTIFMYLILASLYESLVMPLLIMSALPLSFIGAFVALAITGQNMTMFAMIGMVMLLGLVAKNSILLVDYAIQMTRKGVPRNEAIIMAGKVRLRPILMTTIALIAGMLPLAFAFTEVGKFRQSMGVAVIGGLISSLLLTLILIPALFGWADDFRHWSRRLLGRPIDREIDIDERGARLPEGVRTPRQKEHIYN